MNCPDCNTSHAPQDCAALSDLPRFVVARALLPRYGSKGYGTWGYGVWDRITDLFAPVAMPYDDWVEVCRSVAEACNQGRWGGYSFERGFIVKEVF